MPSFRRILVLPHRCRAECQHGTNSSRNDCIFVPRHQSGTEQLEEECNVRKLFTSLGARASDSVLAGKKACPRRVRGGGTYRIPSFGCSCRSVVAADNGSARRNRHHNYTAVTASVWFNAVPFKTEDGICGRHLGEQWKSGRVMVKMEDSFYLLCQRKTFALT